MNAAVEGVGPGLWPRHDRWARWLAFGFCLLAPLGVAALALLLGQDANWDLRNYHWYNAYALLQGRHGFDLLPSQTPFFYNPLLDVPVYLLGQSAPAWVVGAALGWVQGLNAVLLFLIAHAVLPLASPRGRVAAAAGLATLGMLGGGGIAMIGTTFNDNIVSLGILGALVLAIRWGSNLCAGDKLAVPRAVLIGLPAGLALGCKLTLIGFCLPLCLIWLFAGGACWARRLMIGFWVGIGITLGLLVTQGFWMLHLWQHYQSPIFPYFNQIFGSPFAPPSSARDTQFVPSGWREWLLFPYVFTLDPKQVGEIVWRDLRLPLLYALLPLAVLVALARRVPVVMSARLLFAFAALSYGIWLVMFGIYRYLVTLEMLAPLLLVLTLVLLTPRHWRGASLIVLGLVALTVKGGDWGRLPVWEKEFVSVTHPVIAEPATTMLLMAGYEPYSHLIPAFPPLMPVVRLQSNFADPRQRDHGINRVLAERIDAWRGGFLLLLPRWQLPFMDHVHDGLAVFGLRVDPRDCPDVTNHLDRLPYALCPVTRVKG